MKKSNQRIELGTNKLVTMALEEKNPFEIIESSVQKRFWK
jgi:hypothetical protein